MSSSTSRQSFFTEEDDGYIRVFVREKWSESIAQETREIKDDGAVSVRLTAYGGVAQRQRLSLFDGSKTI